MPSFIRNSRRSLALALVLPVLALGVFVGTRPARAGLKNTQPVYITGPDSTVYRAWTAQGSLGSARNSGDGNQYIGCDLSFDYTNPNSPVYSGGCYAQNAVGTYVACTIPTSWTGAWQDLARLLAAQGPTPYIYFKAALASNGQYICQNVHVYGTSDHAVPTN